MDARFHPVRFYFRATQFNNTGILNFYNAMSLDARHTALHILNTLGKGRYTLDRVIEDIFKKNNHLSKRDRGFTNALVFGVLRWRGRLDWIIDYFSKTPIGGIDPGVLNILRLGLFQILFLSRVPVSAAVNTSVELAKTIASAWVVRYVNGLLRNAVRNYKKVPFPDHTKDPVKALAVSTSFPEWLIKRWCSRFGYAETEALCHSINTVPPITIRANTLKTTRDNLSNCLEKKVEQIERTSYSRVGLRFFNPAVPIHQITEFKNGGFQVQDEAAQLVTQLLNPMPGETILDACAGRGGKTGHIAQMMKNQGRVYAMDKDERKLIQLEPEMERLGISIVTTLNHDLYKAFERKPVDAFDRILLDAPCSGLGVLRRNPDTKWSMTREKIPHCKKRQQKFLDNLAHLVKPMGCMVYAVCSFEPEENQEVIKPFLNNHSDFVIETHPGGFADKARSLVSESGYVRTSPHLNNMDGFFSVCLRKTVCR